MTWLGLLLGVACALSRQGSADTVGLTAYGSTQLNAAVERWLSSGGYRRAPALSVAVGVNGQLVFARGYGEARPGLPATEHTIYHIGSLSKQFTAAAVLALVDRGALAPRSNDAINLASSARDFFADVDNWDGSGHGPVTLRGLLTMTSGLPSLIAHPPAQADPWGPITSARMLDQLRTLAVPATSTGFVYNNSAYFLLAEIVETVVAGPGHIQLYRLRKRQHHFQAWTVGHQLYRRLRLLQRDAHRDALVGQNTGLPTAPGIRGG